MNPRVSARYILDRLGNAERGVRWELVGSLGKIRTRRGGREFFLDFRPYGRVWSNRGIRITDEGTAGRLLEQIRAKVADGQSLEEVLATYLPPDAKPNLVPTWLARWIDLKRREARGGSLSPLYAKELDRLAQPGGHFSFLDRHSIHQMTYGVLEDWSLWLADRGQSPKSRRNLLGYIGAFLRWLERRGEIHKAPRVPSVRVDEYEPHILAISDQDLVLGRIPEADRGVFLALAHLGLRPGEARALTVADYRDGWLHVNKAAKAKSASAEIRGTKTGKIKRLPVSEELADWIKCHVDRAGRLTGAPLFPNPRTGRMWAHKAVQRVWNNAVEAAGLPHVSLYEGTKHTMATDAIRRGVPERHLQRFLGHASVQSTRRYARLADNALIEVLRPSSRREREAEESDVATSGRQESEEQSREEPGASWWALQDSNLGASGYEPGALPLS
jgi:integrase/recombinase XerC